VSSIYESTANLSGVLFIAISQSGKSPDLLAATRNAKDSGALTVALCNTPASPLMQLVDVAVPLHAGPEPCVAAAKSYIAGAGHRLDAGRRVVDPFCGAGTIVIESLLARRSAAPPRTGPASGVTAGAVELSSTPDPVGRTPALGSTPGAVPDVPDTPAGVAAFGSAVGFDVSPVAVTCAQANAERAGVRPGLFVADAARPPWTLSSDDVVVTNPPWGRAVLPSGVLNTSDDVLAAVLALAASQRAVVLIDDPDLELADRAVLAVPLSLFGSHPVLAVLDCAGAFPGDSALAEAHAAYG
jgi:hypothetical protein